MIINLYEQMRIASIPKGKEDKAKDLISKGDYLAFIKYDGSSYRLWKDDTGVHLYGRAKSVKGGFNDKIENVPYLKDFAELLPNGTVLEGEIYIPGGTSKNITSIMGCLPAKAIERQNIQGYVEYRIFDCTYLAGEDLTSLDFPDRYAKIRDFVFPILHTNEWNKIHLIPPINQKRLETDLEGVLAEVYANGGEGLVLRRIAKSPYQAAPAGSTPKRPAWNSLKFKTQDTVDVVCMGFEAPTQYYNGKEIESWTYWEDEGGELHNTTYAIAKENNLKPVTKPYFNNWLGSMIIGVWDKDADQVIRIGTVSSGLTDSMKSTDEKEFVGKVFEIQCMSVDKVNKTIRHPFIKCIRDDKTPEECTDL